MRLNSLSAFLIVLVLFSSSAIGSNTPEEKWSKSFGGPGLDVGFSVLEASDGGYVVAGFSESDACLIKTDSNGNEVWNRTFGGPEFDEAYSVQQTVDGGYVVAGSTDYTIWLVKTDSEGNEIWNKTFGESKSYGSNSVQQTRDGGYIIVGRTEYDDILLIKTDSDGNEIWNRTFGGENFDYGESVRQTEDGGYIIVGYTNSYGVGEDDKNIWLIKTDPNGYEEWDRTFGGVGYADEGYSVQQTNDGGYIITGQIHHYEAGNWDVDAWLIKTDSNGIETWNRTFSGISDEWGSGPYSDWGNDVQQAEDGGYVVAGITRHDPPRSSEIWLIKTDSKGNLEWDWKSGGSRVVYAESLHQTSDGGYILAGSVQTRDLTSDWDSWHRAGDDIFLIKLI